MVGRLGPSDILGELPGIRPEALEGQANLPGAVPARLRGGL